MLAVVAALFSLMRCNIPFYFFSSHYNKKLIFLLIQIFSQYYYCIIFSLTKHLVQYCDTIESALTTPLLPLSSLYYPHSSISYYHPHIYRHRRLLADTKTTPHPYFITILISILAVFQNRRLILRGVGVGAPYILLLFF